MKKTIALYFIIQLIVIFLIFNIVANIAYNDFTSANEYVVTYNESEKTEINYEYLDENKIDIYRFIKIEDGLEIYMYSHDETYLDGMYQESGNKYTDGLNTYYLYGLDDLDGLTGEYSVNISTDKSVEEIEKEVSAATGNSINIYEDIAYEKESNGVAVILLVILVSIIINAIAYNQVFNSKKDLIKVKRINGENKKELLYESIKKIFIIFILLDIILLALVLINLDRIIGEYPLMLILTLLVYFGLLLVACFISTKFSLNRIIDESIFIKKEEQSEDEIRSGKFIKIIMGSFSVSVLIFGIFSYATVSAQQELISNYWEGIESYSQVSISASGNESFPEETAEASEAIYKTYDDSGAIYSDFIEPTGIENYTGDGIGVVNPNYLMENEIYDSDGNRVLIDDDEDKIIFLIPEMYMKHEGDITNEIQSLIGHGFDIIWILNNQEVFTYAVEIGQGGLITDPIIIVKTQGNTTTYEVSDINNMWLTIPPEDIHLDETLSYNYDAIDSSSITYVDGSTYAVDAADRVRRRKMLINGLIIILMTLVISFVVILYLLTKSDKKVGKND